MILATHKRYVKNYEDITEYLLKTKLFISAPNPIFLRLVGTNYSYVPGYNQWHKKLNSERLIALNSPRINIENVLSEMSEDIKEQLLFHLDIFI